MTTKEAVEKLTTELKNDPGFRETYKANIAVAFQDEYDYFYKKYNGVTRADIHQISNQAAERFLNNWCHD